jgi:hypothetical protein
MVLRISLTTSASFDIVASESFAKPSPVWPHFTSDIAMCFTGA